MLNKNEIKIKTDQIKDLLKSALTLARAVDNIAQEYDLNYYSDDMITDMENAQTHLDDFLGDVEDWEPEEEDEEEEDAA